MNETIQTLIARRSVRKYKKESIPKEILAEILKAGTYAPSGMNQQSSIILAITNQEVKNQLARMNAKILGKEEMDPFYGAPVVLVVLADASIPTAIYDGSLVMGNLMNAAASLGIGSCWIHRAKEVFETEEGKQLLASYGITGNYIGIGNCILGYADQEELSPSPRKEDYIYYIQ